MKAVIYTRYGGPDVLRLADAGTPVPADGQVLVLLVVRQIREHPLDARALAVPVLAVAAVAVLFLHLVPSGGSDLALDLACVLAGAAMWRLRHAITRRAGQCPPLGAGIGWDQPGRSPYDRTHAELCASRPVRCLQRGRGGSWR